MACATSSFVVGSITLHDETSDNTAKIELIQGMTDSSLRSLISRKLGITIASAQHIIALVLEDQLWLPFSSLLQIPGTVTSLCDSKIAKIVYFNENSNEDSSFKEGIGRPLTAPPSDKRGSRRRRGQEQPTRGKRKEREPQVCNESEV